MRTIRPTLLVLAALGQALALTSTRALATEPSPALLDSSGHAHTLAGLRGEIAVVNFWATWCAPCVAELPMLEAVHRDYAGRGVRFVAVSADDETTRERIPDAVARAGIGFPVWMGATTADMERLGLGSALPATAIFDRGGEIVFRIRGPLTHALLAERLDWLLAERADGAPEASIDTFLAHAAADAEVHGEEHEDCEGEEEVHHDHHGTHEHDEASQVPS